jgi:hypothetical protein
VWIPDRPHEKTRRMGGGLIVLNSEDQKAYSAFDLQRPRAQDTRNDWPGCCEVRAFAINELSSNITCLRLA